MTVGKGRLLLFLEFISGMFSWTFRVGGPCPSDEELAPLTRQLLICRSWELMRAVGSPCEALAHSKEQRGLLQVRVAYVTYTWSWVCRRRVSGCWWGIRTLFSPSISVNSRMVLQTILGCVKPCSETWQNAFCLSSWGWICSSHPSTHEILKQPTWELSEGFLTALIHGEAYPKCLVKYVAGGIVTSGGMSLLLCGDWASSTLKLWPWSPQKVPLPALGSASLWWAASWASSKWEVFSVKMGFHFIPSVTEKALWQYRQRRMSCVGFDFEDR